MEYDKLANEKTEMQRHYVMVRHFHHSHARVCRRHPGVIGGGGGEWFGRGDGSVQNYLQRTSQNPCEHSGDLGTSVGVPRLFPTLSGFVLLGGLVLAAFGWLALAS